MAAKKKPRMTPEERYAQGWRLQGNLHLITEKAPSGAVITLLETTVYAEALECWTLHRGSRMITRRRWRRVRTSEAFGPKRALTVGIQHGELQIRIGIETLAAAAVHRYVTFDVSDPHLFAQSVVRALTQESADVGTPVMHMFDQVTGHVFDIAAPGTLV